jgi:hypothetical protein
MGPSPISRRAVARHPAADGVDSRIMSLPSVFHVRRLKNGAPLKPENQSFRTQMLAIEHAETLDLRAGESVDVTEGDVVVWTSPVK